MSEENVKGRSRNDYNFETMVSADQSDADECSDLSTAEDVVEKIKYSNHSEASQSFNVNLTDPECLLHRAKVDLDDTSVGRGHLSEKISGASTGSPSMDLTPDALVTQHLANDKKTQNRTTSHVAHINATCDNESSEKLNPKSTMPKTSEETIFTQHRKLNQQKRIQELMNIKTVSDFDKTPGTKVESFGDISNRTAEKMIIFSSGKFDMQSRLLKQRETWGQIPNSLPHHKHTFEEICFSDIITNNYYRPGKSPADLTGESLQVSTHSNNKVRNKRKSRTPEKSLGAKRECSSQNDHRFELDAGGASSEGNLLTSESEFMCDPFPKSDNSSAVNGTCRIAVKWRQQDEDQTIALVKDSFDPTKNVLDTEKQFLCSYCVSRFRRKSSLVVHERIHTGEKPYACSYCEMRFRENNHLKNHEMIHTGERPFGCSFCPSKFIRRIDVTIHERIHTGVKPYACSFCDQKFSKNNNLQTHERTHTGEKPYQCCFCTAAFKRRDSLKNHETLHTGDKPHCCSFCGTKFIKRDHLFRHERTHTGEKPFSCALCDAKFSEKYNLKVHQKIHSRDRKPGKPGVAVTSVVKTTDLVNDIPSLAGQTDVA